MKKINRVVLLILLIGLSSNSWTLDPLKSVLKQDLDGDKNPEIFSYTLIEGNPHQASLGIKSGKGEILWDHSWNMKPEDLSTLMQEEGRKDIKEWVSHFFQNRNFDAGGYVQEKLKESDLSDQVIDYWAEKFKVTRNALKKEILSQKTNHTFHYRAEWREDFYALVYLPKTKKFIQYTGYGVE